MSAASPLLGTSRQAIFMVARAFVGPGAYIVDEGAPLTLWPKTRHTEVAVARAQGRGRRSAITFVRVNVDTLATSRVPD